MDIRCGNKGNNITVCKPNGKDKMLCLPANAVQAQLKNGGYLGDCSTVATRDQVTGYETTARIQLQANVAPNPSASSFVLSIKSDDKETPVQLRVVDIMGREVQKFIVASNTLISIGESLKTGVYLLMVRQGNQKPIIHKMVKIN